MKLSEVPRNYDRASTYYDSLTEVVFGRILGLEKYRKDTIERLGTIEGAIVLDVGCGTGRNFPLLLPRIGNEGRLIGLDFSAGMLAQARRRVENEGWHNVDLVRGDAAKLEAISEPVDAVISIWCYGIVYDLEAALNRVIDLLRPGGRIAIMDFQRARPDRGLLHWLYPLYSIALRWTGIDTAEDLDDARLQEKWRRGREVLRARLADVTEDAYQHGAGIILSGEKPRS
jgi:ubiquinone/menaquinone biosynthesis C-methylase UbiE